MRETREWRDTLTSLPSAPLPPASERDGGKGGGESGARQVGDGERERVRGRWTLGSSLPPLPPSASRRDLVSGGRGRGGGGVTVSHARATVSTFLAAGSQKVGAECEGGGGVWGGELGAGGGRGSSCLSGVEDWQSELTVFFLFLSLSLSPSVSLFLSFSHRHTDRQTRTHTH